MVGIGNGEALDHRARTERHHIGNFELAALNLIDNRLDAPAVIGLAAQHVDEGPYLVIGATAQLTERRRGAGAFVLAELNGGFDLRPDLVGKLVSLDVDGKIQRRSGRGGRVALRGLFAPLG